MFGQMNMPQIYQELRPEAKSSVSALVAIACVAVTALYLLLGGAGYAAFGSGAMSDVVAQIAKQESGVGGVVVVIHSLMGSFIVLKTPLTVMPLKNISLKLLSDFSFVKLPETPRHSAPATTYQPKSLENEETTPSNDEKAI